MPEPAANPTPVPAAEAPAGHTLIRRLRFLSAMAVAALIWWHVGWFVVGPADPLGPVMMVTARQDFMMMFVELLGLGVISGGLAVAVCGSDAASNGPVAVAAGLAAMNLRGGHIDDFITGQVARAAVDPDVSIFPVTKLLVETILWLVVIGSGYVSGLWVESWFTPGRGRRSGESQFRLTERDNGGLGIIAFITTTIVAWMVLLFAAGGGSEDVLKGQTYFAVGVSLAAGAAVAYLLVPTSPGPWMLASVALLTVIAYAYGQPTEPQLDYSKRTFAYLILLGPARALPIEFASLGILGLFWGLSIGRQLRHPHLPHLHASHG